MENSVITVIMFLHDKKKSFQTNLQKSCKWKQEECLSLYFVIFEI